MSDIYAQLVDKIKKRNATIGIFGLGYVGLSLAIATTKAGYKVIGIDINYERIKKIKNGKSYISDIKDSTILQALNKKLLIPTSNFDELHNIDIICICVPTPVNVHHEPAISDIINSTKNIAKYLHSGQLIILESTTYPGTTRQVILPILNKSPLPPLLKGARRPSIGKDYFLAFSPERINPGDKAFNTKNTPKIVGGITQKCTNLAHFFYSQFIDKVIKVSSPEIAEAEKLFENIFRNVNIALANEMAMLCKKLDIDIWEVISAAATKPYGFMPFYPGIGIGGHCIPLDPLYLIWKAKKSGFNSKFIKLAVKINQEMPNYVVRILKKELISRNVQFKSARILVLGLAYKKNVNDYRESPSLKIFSALLDKNIPVDFNDPYIPKVKIKNKIFNSTKLNYKNLYKYDAILIATDHTRYNYNYLVKNSKLVFDTRNATKNIISNKIIKVI